MSPCRAQVWLACLGGVPPQTPLEGGVPLGHLPWPASSALGIESQAVQGWERGAVAPSCKIAGSWVLHFGGWPADGEGTDRLECPVNVEYL